MYRASHWSRRLGSRMLSGGELLCHASFIRVPFVPRYGEGIWGHAWQDIPFTAASFHLVELKRLAIGHVLGFTLPQDAQIESSALERISHRSLHD
jgi:hypothetical protein